jgi:putative DNA primase/helicase
MSTSANLVNEATGKSHQSHGEHLYLLVQDGTDARRFLYALHDLCWLAGLGWYIVGRAGQLLERSIVDKMVCAPERLVFEASPDLEPPLKQEKREATIREGAPLDTRAACINLDKPGQAQLKRQKDAAAKALGKEAAGARTAFVEEKTGGAVARGMGEAAARLMAEQWGDSILRPGVILEFDDRDLGAIDVAAILADPGRFDGETLADPIEGVAYGRNCAIVQMRDGTPSIFSFAHGGARYELRPEDEAPPPAIVGDGVEGGDVAAFSVTVIWLSEDTLALVFADRHASGLRYVANWGKWLAWTGTYWAYEKTLAVYDIARKVCRGFVQPGANPRVLLTQAKTMAAIETLARSDRRLAAIAGQWDADQLLFNMTEGSVELSNGAIMPNNSMDYCMKVAGTDAAPPGTPCPLWLAFLDTAMNGDQALIAYLQRVCGYCLTGLIKEHALFFLYGTGGNGKGVFINTLRGIFGTYRTTAPIDTFTVTNSTSHPTDLAGLMGARLVTAVETEEGRPWAESKIKALTGGDEISARFMRQDFFSFTPTFKLMIAGNHKPRLRSVDEAMRRRFHLIPFAVTIPKADRDIDLVGKLKAEWPAILRWMIDGCMIWQKMGLAPPQAVIDATNKYLESEDAIS